MKTQILLGILLGSLAISAQAVVLYDEGRESVNGVTLLRDKDDPKAYYYLPTTPSIAIDPVTNKPRILLIRFEEPGGGTSGGLVHFLFGLSMPTEQVEDLGKELSLKVPGATIKGPVVLRAEGDDNSGGASFKIISTTIANVGNDDSFNTSLVVSGDAPVTENSQAAVAARLSKHGATLLWDSLKQPTSDISISVNASYEAALPAFRGTVSANLDTAYNHLFKLKNKQEAFKKDEIRDQMDELVRAGVINVDVTDRAGSSINTSKLSGVMSLVTDKLVSMLFDTSQGFSKLPEQEKIPSNVVKGRQKRGFITKLFGGTGNQRYVGDDQYVLRKKTDIKRASFSMLFTQNTTIRVPFNTAGNISGLYDEWGDDNSLFRLVSLDDAFNKQEVYVNLDMGGYDALLKYVNSVSVAFVKKYPDELNQRDFSQQIIFTHDEIKNGVLSKPFKYPGFGLNGNELHSYGYRVLWSLRGGRNIGIPDSITDLRTDNTKTLTLSLPAETQDIEIFADGINMNDAQVRRATVNIEYVLLGESKRENVTVTPENAGDIKATSLLHDRDSIIRYRITWYGTQGTERDEWLSFDGEQIEIFADSH